MNRRIILGTVLAVLSILSAVSLSSPHPTAYASTNPVLGIWNAIRNTNNVTDASLTSGTTFTMDVNITNAGPISAFDITLSYQISGFIVPNPLSVSQDDITFDCSVSQPNNSCLFGRQCNFALVKRDISYAPYYTIRVAAASNCDVDGNGTLFSVTFHVTNVGVTSFDIIQAGALLTGVKDTLVVAGGTPHPLPNLQVKGAYFENVPNTPTPPV